MSTFLKAAALSLSTLLVALPTMAASAEQHQQATSSHAQKHRSDTQHPHAKSHLKKPSRPVKMNKSLKNAQAPIAAVPNK